MHYIFFIYVSVPYDLTMPEKQYALVELSSVINEIIYNTFQTAQRIKLTAFDVSSKYIIFGTNTGGIYIFTREPCQFFKLIPSTHGSTNILQISPNEEHLAIAVSTGLVIVLEGVFTPHFEQQVFTEHENKTVTAMKWSGNDLYCGDSIGRVSVITLKNFLTKAMFQTPVACLMHLDSQIVHLDTYSKFLLISTQTRSLLCDTETEKYRQIGKKMREGPFGACFLNSAIMLKAENGTRTEPFTGVSENEQLSQFEDNKVRIYCARPGIRLWQADFQGNVVVTHQFRSSLPQKPSDIIKWDGTDELKIQVFECKTFWENFNLGKIYSFLGKFILSFRDDGFCIFEPCSSALLFWSTHLKNIKDIKIVDSILYIWHDLKVSMISLLSVEEMMLRSLVKKNYKLCGELCVKFFDEIEALLSTSKNIHLISALENKLEDAEMLNKLTPIFERLKDYARIPLEKLKNGIVTVNALPMLPESVQNFEVVEKDPEKEHISILLEQFRIHKIRKTIETADFAQMMKFIDSYTLYELITKFKAEANEDCDTWCKEIFLKYIKNLENISTDALNYACRAFLEINHCENLVCKCNFPLPRAHQTIPKYYKIGCELMRKSDSYDLFLKQVPYMYRFVLNEIDSKDIRLKTPLVIQFSDEEIIEIHSNKIMYDIWDECIRLLLKLKTGQCLHCGAQIDCTGCFKWTDFGLLMVESIKATNAIKLFKRYSHLLPKGELDQFFYQYCLFSSVTNIKTHLKQTLRNENVQKQFGTSVSGYLRRQYLRRDYYDSPSHKTTDLYNCDHCHLPLKIPILDDVKKLICGHQYHEMCFLYNKSQCFICEPVL